MNESVPMLLCRYASLSSSDPLPFSAHIFLDVHSGRILLSITLHLTMTVPHASPLCPTRLSVRYWRTETNTERVLSFGHLSPFAETEVRYPTISKSAFWKLNGFRDGESEREGGAYWRVRITVIVIEW